MKAAQMFAAALEHHRAGRLPQAEAIYRQILAANPREPSTLHMLGVLAGQAGHPEHAVNLIQQAIAVAGESAETLANLGKYQQQLGDAVGAMQSFQRALKLAPNHLEVVFELANLHHLLGQREECLAWYRRATEIGPKRASAWSNLGNAYYALGDLDEAIESYHRAIALEPNEAFPHNNLGSALKDARRVDEAIASFRRAVELQPNLASADSNLLYTLHFHPDYGAPAILREHQRWARHHAASLARSIMPHENDRSPDRRLRIGYVSGDFREHSVGRFMLPLLEQHDRTEFEIRCFSDLPAADAMTPRFQSLADRWHNIAGMTDAAVAELVRREKIDILVDLSLHMAFNRMLVFALKPAPVQITYLAYGGTSGLETMDYRFTDPHLDPEGEDGNYVEKSIRLKSYWCYAEPPAPAGGYELAPAPVRLNGFITFGCLNSFSKVSDTALATWKRVLDATPDSRILLFAAPGRHRDVAATILGAERVEFIGQQSLADYMRTYNRIDIALDPFPYGGGTTSCDALWMGVPVVTLAGRTAVGRGGLSLLSQLGLGELINRSEDEYVATATRLAGDSKRLGELRASLRDRMLASPLCNAVDFARDIEAKYRQIWRDWCGGGSFS